MASPGGGPSRTAYTIGFTIREARNLKTAGGLPADPLVVVRGGGREFRTSVKKGKSNVAIWEESCVWSNMELSDKELETTFLIFEVQTANAFWRNDVIGSFSLQLSVVRSRRTRQLTHTFPLHLPNDTTPQGSLRVTVFARGADDAPVREESEGAAGGDGGDEAAARGAGEDIRAAAIGAADGARGDAEGRCAHLVVSVHRVEDLLPSPAKGSRDPFVTVEFAGSRLQSSQATGTCSWQFNEGFRIPVGSAGLFENTIGVSVWDWNLLGSNELLAYGRLSFADVRAKPITGRWFNFYGAVAAGGAGGNAAAAAAGGASAGGNGPAATYMGRLLLSARVERVASRKHLLPAQVVAAKPVESALSSRTLTFVADVYEAVGLSGGELALELAVGPVKGRTAFVKGAETAGAGDAAAAIGAAAPGALASAVHALTGATPPSSRSHFIFDQRKGRIEPLTVEAPLDLSQVWDVFLIAYAREAGGKGGRPVAYVRLKLSDVPLFSALTPKPPIWVPLRPFDGAEEFGPTAAGRDAAAALLAFGQIAAETATRGKRQFMARQRYEVRCYIYAAKHLPRAGDASGSPRALVRVSCAGETADTAAQQTASRFPVFLQCCRLLCTLPIDPALNMPPSVPVTLSVLHAATDRKGGAGAAAGAGAAGGVGGGDAGGGGAADEVIARAVVSADRIRGKPPKAAAASAAGASVEGALPPLRPHWVTLRVPRASAAAGGAAAALVAIEVVREQDAAKTPVSLLRPELHACLMSLSVYGLRNAIFERAAAAAAAATGGALAKLTGAGLLESLMRGQLLLPLLPGGAGAAGTLAPLKRPLLLVSVPAYAVSGEGAARALLPWEPGRSDGRDGRGDPGRQKWVLKGRTNCDFFSVIQLSFFAPRDAVFDPHVNVALYERKLKPKYFVGDVDVPLLPFLPWVAGDLEGALAQVKVHADFAEVAGPAKVLAALDRLAVQMRNKPRGGFANLALELVRDDGAAAAADAAAGAAAAAAAAGAAPAAAVVGASWLGPDGVPLALREAARAAAQGVGPAPPVAAVRSAAVSVFVPKGFLMAAHGKAVPVTLGSDSKESEYRRPSVLGPLEDFIDLDSSWLNFELSSKVGEQVCTVADLRMGISLSTPQGSRITSFSDRLKDAALSEAQLLGLYRREPHLPRRIRVRCYVIRAIGLAVEGAEKHLHPYLHVSVGSRNELSRSVASASGAHPTFNYVLETDVSLPEFGQLEISVWHKAQGVKAALAGSADVFIGSTVVDLEQRWFSADWQRLADQNAVPIELRPLKPLVKANVKNAVERRMGTLEMWVDLFTLQRAAAVPRAVLREPPSVEVELRIIVWGVRALNFQQLGTRRAESVDAQVLVSLDCSSYAGEHPVAQSTDVHYYSRNGNAIYNWRVVYDHIRLPTPSCVVQVAAFDYKTLGSPVFLAEVNLELRPYLEKVVNDLSAKEYTAEFALVNRRRREEGSAATAAAPAAPGFVQLTLQILPQADASGKPAGVGRSQPNDSPYLPTPIDGRKWEDFLWSTGAKRDYSAIYERLRFSFILVSFFVLFITGLIYPGLFFQ